MYLQPQHRLLKYVVVQLECENTKTNYLFYSITVVFGFFIESLLASI